ncbi:TonB-dependent receptor [Aliikangiella marina]|uniref:TonB-dependent receptor n=1 Tax=Aliikangiella marina TaxID=1712262 RepID=A0A545T9Z7_9GAMM|nr:TonB-dependent receptor [Aliikangiella marina]TQV74043.1 TonB-dependent receptor [Aliikangiella marina]
MIRWTGGALAVMLTYIASVNSQTRNDSTQDIQSSEFESSETQSPFVINTGIAHSFAEGIANDPMTANRSTEDKILPEEPRTITAGDSDDSSSELESVSSDFVSFADAPVLVVTGSRHDKDKAFINDFVAVSDSIGSPISVTELLANEAGLNVNGQPGLFQTLSIRGLARQRVQVYVNGMRITSERRAGVAASFIDASLLSGAEVTQGPASTYYGSGAIGGTIHLVTRQDESRWFNGSLKSDGNERLFAFGVGDSDYTTGLAIRERDNGETISGEEKNNNFSQVSFNYLRHASFNQLKLDWQLIYSKGDDLGKDNLRFPDSRITSYPNEEHILSQFTLSGDGDWQARLYFHEQELITQDIRPLSRVNEVTTDSLDVGFAFEQPWLVNDFEGIFGLDYFARRDVNSFEEETSLSNPTVANFIALNKGQEDEAALFATANRQIDSWSFSAGLRLNYQTQKSDDTATVSDDFITYFASLTKSIGELDVSLSYGTGFRFASLSERLFNGTTGRGQIFGNPNLLPEESSSFDLGFNYSYNNWRFTTHFYETEVDNFIERVSLDDDTRTFENRTNGDISGWQYNIDYQATDELSFSLNGQKTTGEDELGNSLSDIPPERHRLAINLNKDNWFFNTSYIIRQSKSNFGDGELPLESAQIVALKFGTQVSQNWEIALFVDNLFNERYFNSADDLNTLATGREFGINFSYIH